MKVFHVVLLCILFTFTASAVDWTSRDIQCGKEGKTEVLAGGFVNIEGSGRDIWDSADGFRFVYQQMSGDFEIKARLKTMTQPDGWSKAGLMIRQSVDPSSIHAFVGATGSNGFAYQHRTQHGGSSTHNYGGPTASPDDWLKLERANNVIKAYKSTDDSGQVFVQIGELVLNSADSVLVGMAVTAHKDGDICKAEFRDVNLRTIVVPLIGNGSGLYATYFNDQAFSEPALARFDSAHFNFGDGSPDSSIAADTFSARWIGEVQAQLSEHYTFYVNSDDGARLWVNGTLVIDQWTLHGPIEYASAPIALARGQKVGIRLEYFEQGGGAVCELKWSSPNTAKAAIPATQLYGAHGLSVRIPQKSLISPACVEGMAWSVDGGSSSVTANGSATTKIGSVDFFTNIPLGLSPTSATFAHANGATSSGEIEWEVANLAQKDYSNFFLLRKNDALLLTSTGIPAQSGPLTITISDATGAVVLTYNGVPGQLFPTEFAVPGTYVVEAKINTSSAGKATVVVHEADLSKPIACGVGFEREKDVVIAPISAAGNVSFYSSDPAWAAVTTVGPFNTVDGQGTRILIKGLAKGNPSTFSRIGGNSGPILSQQRVDQFTIHTDGIFQAVVNSDTRIGGTLLRMEPFVPNVTFEFNMFASSSTFAGGVKSFSCNTSDPCFKQIVDPITGVIKGEMFIVLEIPPGENSYCFNVRCLQASSESKTIYEKTGVNGCVCTGSVGSVKMCIDKTAYLSFSSGVGGEKPDDCKIGLSVGLPSGVELVNSSDTEKLFFTCGQGDSVEIKGTSAGEHTVTINGASFEKAITVVKITLAQTSIKMCKGKFYKNSEASRIAITIEPSSVADSYVTLSQSGDGSVEFYDHSGTKTNNITGFKSFNVKAVNGGNVTATATMDDSPNCKVDLSIKVLSVDLEAVDNTNLTAGRMCINAQAKYKKAKWKAIVKPDGYATVSAGTGITLKSSSSVQNGDEIEVEATGTTTGEYTLYIEHDDDDSCTGDQSEKIFKFVFKNDPKGPTSGDADGGGTRNADENLAIGWVDPNRENQVTGAQAGRKFELNVATEPSDSDGAALYTGDVEGDVLVKFATKDWSMGAMREYHDRTPTSIGLSYQWLSVSGAAGAPGDAGVSVMAVSAQIILETKTKTITGIDHSSNDITPSSIAGVDREESWSGTRSDQPLDGEMEDRDRTYSVGGTAKNLEVTVAAASKWKKGNSPFENDSKVLDCRVKFKAEDVTIKEADGNEFIIKE